MTAVRSLVPDIYDSDFVESLFNEMANTYEMVNQISSFGFSKRWRRQFVSEASIKPGMVVCDLMCGMGECWPAIASRLSDQGRIVGIDLSTQMLHGAERSRRRFQDLDVVITKQDALVNTLADESADCVICGFGVKTLSTRQQERLAEQIRRILKPRGTFSLIEVSVPAGWTFKGLYMFYLHFLHFLTLLHITPRATSGV